jgi:DNA-binding NarL/FixJ family response regulator
MNKQIKIIIADDHRIFAEGLRNIIDGRNGIAVTAIADNGKQLLGNITDDNCDVVLLDINMPEMDGLEALELLKQKHPRVKILVLTMYNRMEFVKKMVSKGVHGYVLKNIDIEKLIEAIQFVYEGKSYFSEELKDAESEETRFDDGFSNKLSAREKEILKLIVSGKSSTQIGEVLFISAYTVDTHRKNMMHKLKVRTTAELIKYALQIGIS